MMMCVAHLEQRGNPCPPNEQCILCERAELRSKLESAHRTIDGLKDAVECLPSMESHRSLEKELHKTSLALRSAELQVESLRKALWEILGTVQGSHPNPYKEVQTMAKAALDGCIEKRHDEALSDRVFANHVTGGSKCWCGEVH